MALLEAEVPEGCQRTIYLCDDGKDPLKRDWVESLGADVIYVSGAAQLHITPPPLLKRSLRPPVSGRTMWQAMVQHRRLLGQLSERLLYVAPQHGLSCGCARPTARW